MKTLEPANNNDIFQGKGPFKGFRNEAVDAWPENVVELGRKRTCHENRLCPCVARPESVSTEAVRVTAIIRCRCSLWLSQ